MSFGFYVREEDMSQAGRRILRDIDLREISIVERAAYPEANIAARSISFTKARVRAFLSLRKVPPCQI
jgi:phage head maturation protease